MTCGVGCRLGLGLVLLWPVAAALIRPLAWEPPYAMGVTQEMTKRQKKKKKKGNLDMVPAFLELTYRIDNHSLIHLFAHFSYTFSQLLALSEAHGKKVKIFSTECLPIKSS